jgi:hypothetical protein
MIYIEKKEEYRALIENIFGYVLTDEEFEDLVTNSKPIHVNTWLKVGISLGQWFEFNKERYNPSYE